MKTFARFLFSYLLPCIVFILGSYYIVTEKLQKLYFEQRVDTIQLQLDGVANQVRTDLNFLTQIEDVINSNQVLRNYRFKFDHVNRNDAELELKKIADCSESISSVVYMSKENLKPVSTKYLVNWKNDSFEIIDANGEKLILNQQFFNNTHSNLAYLSGDSTGYLIYFPTTHLFGNSYFFFILDESELVSQMKLLISSETEAVALVDVDDHIVVGVNTSLLMPYLELQDMSQGKYMQEDGNYLCISNQIKDGYRLISYISDQAVNERTGLAFKSSYRSFILLFLVCIVSIYPGMLITYYPLNRLVNKIVGKHEKHDEYYTLLEATFDQNEYEDRINKEKLDSYRTSMQQVLLDSLIPNTSKIKEIFKGNVIDQFFDVSVEKQIFIIYVCSSSESLPLEILLKELMSIDEEKVSCYVLDQDEKKATLLICSIGKELDERFRDKHFLYEFYERYQCYSAISTTSNSLLDIPELYENIISASRKWPDVPVVEGIAFSEKKELVFPHNEINELINSLAACDHQTTRQLVDAILQLLSEVQNSTDKYRNYYTQNVFLSILGNIINAMNDAGIHGDRFNDIYYEILDYLRSGDPCLMVPLIGDHIKRLLEIYESEKNDKRINRRTLIEVMKMRGCQANFSINELADEFGLSVPNMSLQFKMEMGETFTDYLQRLRIDKAKELLAATDSTVEEIANMVGYYSRTSFINKFKKTTGMTPSQFRVKSCFEQEKGDIL